MPILLNKTIRLFLDSIGRRDEYEFYLRNFQADPGACFAILCPERNGFEQVAQVFAFDLQFLQQLQLAPLILLCGPESFEIQRLLFEEEHEGELLELTVDQTDFVPKVQQFLSSCRTAGKIAVLRVADAKRNEVLNKLMPKVSRRTHIIRFGGPLRAANGHILNYYYTQHPQALVREDEPLAAEAADLLQSLPGSHISITSPWNLLKELFTVKGAGCLIRRGSHIERMCPPLQPNQGQLTTLLEDSFGKKLRHPVELNDISEAYIADDYTAAALLEQHEAGFYLSKFAVGTQARGEGLAQELWREIINDHPALFWRARMGNPINHWYEKNAEGFYNSAQWRVFWRGIPYQQLQAIIGYSLDRPADFVE